MLACVGESYIVVDTGAAVMLFYFGVQCTNFGVVGSIGCL